MILNIQPNVQRYTGYPVKYPTGCQISGMKRPNILSIPIYNKSIFAGPKLDNPVILHPVAGYPVQSYTG